MDENKTAVNEYPPKEPPKIEAAKKKCPPKNPCDDLGMWIANSALDFENAVTQYLLCQCKTIEKLLCSGQEDLIVPMLRSFKENLEQICCIEKQLLYKLDKGLCIGPCDKDREC